MFPSDWRPLPEDFSSVLDGINRAVVVYGPEDRLLYLNRAAGSLFSVDRARSAAEQVRSFWEGAELLRLDGSVLPREAWPLSRLLRGERFDDLLLRLSDSQGKRSLVLSFDGRTVAGEAGPLRLLAVEDATARFEAEELFRTAFERSPVPITLARRGDRRVLDANRAYLELLGYRRADVVGRSIAELGFILNQAEVEAAGERLDRREDVERLEVRVRTRAGEERTLLSWHRVVEVGGQPCSLGVFVDVTEQQEMERQLRAATQTVLQSAAAFSRSVVEQLEQLRGHSRLGMTTGQLEPLTRRERQVLARVGAGQSNRRIAEALELTPQTVRNYVTRIYRKIGVENRAEAVVWARERGLVEA